MSEQRDDGGPAFPIIGGYGEKIDNAAGMTLRDYFAGIAMPTFFPLLINSDTTDDIRVRRKAAAVAALAYQMADLMLLERAK